MASAQLPAKTGRAAVVASMASAATLPKLRLKPRCHGYFQWALISARSPVRRSIQFLPTSRFLAPASARYQPSGCLFPAEEEVFCTHSCRYLQLDQRLCRASCSEFQTLLRSSRNAGRDSFITEDKRKSDLSLENVKASVVSRDDDEINVRVQLPGKATQKVFDEALAILARDAPPVPGFRKSKGGKTSNIPSSILLQMLGKSRVTKFVLQEILSITIEEFVKKENLKVNPEIKTTQSEGEMESAFMPGSAFEFNVILQLEKSDSDENSEGQSDTKE